MVTLVNKKTGIFTANDESFVEAFGIFCGLALANVSNYEQLRAAEARKQVRTLIKLYIRITIMTSNDRWPWTS